MPSSEELSFLLHALAAFFQEHRRCGDLDGEVGGDRVWTTAPAAL
jgi:hypothetical protein